MASILLAAVVIVPWIFTISLQDSFGLPKFVALWTVLLFVTAILVVATRRGIGAAGWLRPGWVDLAIVGFLAWNLVSFALSPDRHQSLFGEVLQHQGVLALLLYLGFYLVARLAIDSVQRVGLVLVAVASSGVVVALYATVQKAGLDPIWGRLVDDRAFSTLGQSNALAAFLVLAVSASAALAWSGGFGPRMLWTAAAVLSSAGLLFSRSRGGYLGLLISLAVLGIVAIRTRPSARMVVLVVGAVVVGGSLVSVFVPSIRSFERDQWNRALSTANVEGDPSVRMHLDTWNVGLHVALDHPITGAGPEIFPEVFPHYRDALLSPAHARAFYPYRVESPHNVYLAIADAAGFPALAAYLAVIVGFVLALWKALKAAPARSSRILLVGLLAAVAGHLVTDVFMTAEVTTTWLFWVFIAAGVAVARGASDREDAAPVTTAPATAPFDDEGFWAFLPGTRRSSERGLVRS